MSKINQNKKEEWLNKGGPEEALEFLETATKELSNKAEESGAIFKDGEGNNNMEKDVAEEIAANTEEEDVSTEDNAEVKSEAESEVDGELSDDTSGEDTKDVGVEEDEFSDEPEEVAADVNADVVKSLEVFGQMVVKSVEDGIAAYHEAVVVPLLEELSELKSAKKSEASSPFTDALSLAFSASDMLPAAAVASAVKTRFGSQATVDEEEDVVVDDAELEEKTIVKSAAVDETNVLLAGI